MDSVIQQLALVSESATISASDLMRVAAALQKQASRDLAPVWNISATIDAFEKLEDVPLGYWPMVVRDDIGYDAAGIHLDNDRQPFALISASSDIDHWSLTASHETLEMLVDPYGDRLIAGNSPKKDQGRVSFLVEVADPSEAAEFAYTCNNVRVSDFYTPRYFDPVAASGVRYSFMGVIKEPRQVLKGGYLSWVDPVTSHWWQQTWFGGSKPAFRDLGKLDPKAGSLRSQIDRLSTAESARANATKHALVGSALVKQASARSTASKARMWKSQIDQIVAAPKPRQRRSATRRAGPAAADG
ncbi:hypothetical protein [Tardiphaga sp. 619_E2_N8_5]|uniref:hypothetical protein n=1 Tax=unclassified Tardiphaga TaxID=2631404 RepID=UPI003F25A0E7